MDYEALRGGLQTAIPFNQYIGLAVVEVADGRGEVTLPDRDELRNHVGTQHAGALFSAGEAASGAAFMGAFADRLSDMTPLAESADISYRKIAKGAITASARLAGDKEELLRAFDSAGRVRFPIEVQLTNPDGEVVAEMIVHWHARKNAPA
jgi:acyl-coenzyme A thioesterase PaaI-like protein